MTYLNWQVSVFYPGNDRHIYLTINENHGWEFLDFSMGVANYTEQDMYELSKPSPAEHIYNMINTECPLEEKMTLFWHDTFNADFFKAIEGRDPEP